MADYSLKMISIEEPEDVNDFWEKERKCVEKMQRDYDEKFYDDIVKKHRENGIEILVEKRGWVHNPKFRSKDREGRECYGFFNKKDEICLKCPHIEKCKNDPANKYKPWWETPRMGYKEHVIESYTILKNMDPDVRRV